MLAAGGFRVRVDPDAGDLALLKGDETLLHFPLYGLELGTVTALDDAANYDPTALAIPNALQPPPGGLEFLAVTSIEVTSKSASSLAITLRYPGGNQATLAVAAQAEGRFRLQIVPASGGAPVAYFRLRPRVDAAGGFYGPGESFDDVNQRGKIRRMQLETDGELESHYNKVHVPIPLLIGTRGWGMLIDSWFPGVFAVANDEADHQLATLTPVARRGLEAALTPGAEARARRRSRGGSSRGRRERSSASCGPRSEARCGERSGGRWRARPRRAGASPADHR